MGTAVAIVAVVDLGFFSRRGQDHHAGLGQLGSAKLVNEALDALVAAAKSAVRNQVLPNRHSITTATQPQFDQLTIRLAGTGRRTTIRTWGNRLVSWFCRVKAGSHLNGRF